MIKTYLCSFLTAAIVLNSSFAPLASADELPPCQTALTPTAAPVQAEKSVPRKIFEALLTFPIPYYPLKEIITDTNKRFYALVEKPSVGIITTIIGVSLARFLSPSQSTWGANFADAYVSYTVKDVVANGVALQSNLSGTQKYWVNYLYTIASYAIVTISTAKVWDQIAAVLSHPQTASAASVAGASYAIALIAFGIAWPLLSQVVNTTIAPPIVFNRFLQKQDSPLLDKEKSPDSQAIYKNFEAQIAKLDSSATVKDKKESKYLRFRYMWVKWRRDGLQTNDMNPFTGGKVKTPRKPLSTAGYWFLRTSVITAFAATLIVGYFALRNYTVGTSAQDPGVFTTYLQTHIEQMRDSDLNAQATAIMQQTPKEILEQNL